MHPASWGISLALSALMALLAPDGRRAIGGPGPAGWLRLVLMAAIAAGVVSSFQILASTRAAAVWCAFAFVFVFCRGLPATRTVVLASVIVAGSGLAAHGIYQSLYGFEELAGAAGSGLSEAMRARISSGRAVSTMGLPGALAGFLSLSLPLTLGLALRGGGTRFRRAAAWTLASIQAGGLLATRSAAGILSLALSGAVAAWWARGDAPSSRKRAVPILLAAAGLAGAITVMAMRGSGPGAADEGTGPLALRIGNWQVAARIFLEHPVLGTGAGCYGIAFPRHRTWEMNESRYAHNSYLQILAECGIVAGAAALMLAVGLAISLRRRARGGAAAPDPFLTASCLSFLFHNVADFTFYLPAVGFPFFALAGVALDGDGHAGEAPAGRRPLVAAAALALAAFALFVTRGEIAREEARIHSRDESLGAPLAADAVRANRFDPEARSLLSHLLMERGLRTRDLAGLREAEAEAQRAVDLDPRTPHHWHHLGRVRLALQDPLGALVALTRAAELYPIRLEYRDDRDAVAATLSSGGGSR